MTEPVFDRSFATEPPACIATATAFRWADGRWIEALADSTGQIKTQTECLSLVADWIYDERNARNHFDQLNTEAAGPGL